MHNGTTNESGDINKDCLNYRKFFLKYGNIKINEDERLFDASIALLKHENNKIENASQNEIEKAMIEINWFVDIAFDKFCQRKEAISKFAEEQKQQARKANKKRETDCVLL